MNQVNYNLVEQNRTEQNRTEQNRTEQNRTERNNGIELLRIFSMFLVVILHILGHGGVLDNATGANKYITWVLEISACCAVDIYALISGYVGYTEKPKSFKSAKFLTLWSQVFCYSLGITLCAFLIKPESIGIKTLIRSAFPVASNQYWFFSCYVGLFLLMPWLNRLIRSLDNRNLTKLIVVMFCTFSLFMMFVGRLSDSDPFKLCNGYSTIWLTILYITGAWMKRINAKERVQIKHAWLIVVFCVLISWLFKCVFPGFIQTGVFVSYVSPTILLIAMAYLVIFAKTNINGSVKKIITFFAPAAFGVYLIHEQPIIRECCITDRFEWIASIPTVSVVFVILGCALAILIGCLLIEKVRLFLFKTLKINYLLSLMGDKLDNVLNKIDDIISNLSVSE